MAELELWKEFKEGLLNAGNGYESLDWIAKKKVKLKKF